jgi:hypothetical protein
VGKMPANASQTHGITESARFTRSIATRTLVLHAYLEIQLNQADLLARASSL